MDKAAKEFGKYLARARSQGGFPRPGSGGGSSSGGGSGGNRPPNLGAVLGGSGVVFALAAGGLLVNSALYNGTLPVRSALDLGDIIGEMQ